MQSQNALPKVAPRRVLLCTSASSTACSLVAHHTLAEEGDHRTGAKLQSWRRWLYLNFTC
jgi:hypothetical protein